jgi:hypothetical protein
MSDGKIAKKCRARVDEAVWGCFCPFSELERAHNPEQTDESENDVLWGHYQLPPQQENRYYLPRIQDMTPITVVPLYMPIYYHRYRNSHNLLPLEQEISVF